MRILLVSLVALAFGFFGSMPLAGPIAVLTVSRAARGRFDEALRIAAGAAVAEGIYAGVAFWGFTTFLARNALIVPISHGATAVVLTALGARFVFWRMNAAEDAHESRAGTLLLGFSVSLLNPTLLLTWSAAVAFVYSRHLAPASALAALPFGACAAAGIAGWFACLVALMRKYRGKIPGNVLTYGVRGMGVALIGLGIAAGVALVHWIREPSERAKTPGASLSLPSCAGCRSHRPWLPDTPPCRWSSTAPTTRT
jgi:threonine/homoserine/homoserine lactone efflux protein